MARGRPSRSTIYARLDAAIEELETRLGGLPSPKESEAIWSNIWHLEAHHSTALEGNTLVLRQVEALLQNGRAVGAKPLKQYMEVKGYADAAKWVYSQAIEPDAWSNGDLISLAELRRIHEMAMTPVWDVAPHPDANEHETPGNFRQHDIHPFDAGMTPPPWTDVAAQTRDWISEVGRLGKRVSSGKDLQIPITEDLAQLHNKFERIHPFIDGNGRAGRLALNLLLVRLGYPPVIIFKTQRDAYLTAMQKADAGDHGPLGELIARAMLENLNRFIVPNLAGPVRLVPLAALANDNFTVPALRQAAQRGRLDAVQGADGIWRSSKKAVADYAKKKYDRRPKST